jgi:hypothetical protein
MFLQSQVAGVRLILAVLVLALVVCFIPLHNLLAVVKPLSSVAVGQ